jgi:hypothetical protein
VSSVRLHLRRQGLTTMEQHASPSSSSSPGPRPCVSEQPSPTCLSATHILARRISSTTTCRRPHYVEQHHASRSAPTSSVSSRRRRSKLAPAELPVKHGGGAIEGRAAGGGAAPIHGSPLETPVLKRPKFDSMEIHCLICISDLCRVNWR